MKKTVLALIAAAGIALVLPLDAQSQDAGSRSVSECVMKELEVKKYIREASVEVFARVPGPGWRCRPNRMSRTGCLEAAKGFAIIGVPSVQRIGCIADRCSSSPIQMVEEDDRTVQACITVHTWSESHCFGGGGSASFLLTGEVERNAEAGDILEVLKRCEEEIAG